ncbi:zinc ribbon domain-containing protein [Methylomonas sp. AM2-LC]|uniref:zinc ribbon domain-containing protein n=1 Tax=Methylomonas sp. AM2-LC TaxID=3153301 RepID=UPI003266378E
MICPKCNYKLSVESPSCPQCGIVFQKYFKYHPKLSDHGDFQTPAEAIPPRLTATSNELLTETQPSNPANLIGGLIIIAGLIIWSWQLIGPPIVANAAGNSFLHMVNLPFHEAGHIIFRPFGAFITSLGGTLGQLLMPSICMGVLLLKNRDPFAASVALWWIGENFLDIAPYMNDARSGTLPLLGGNFGHSAPYGFHDWQYLLTESGLLVYDHTLAKMVFAFGSFIMLLALAWSSLWLFKRYQQLKYSNTHNYY